MLRRTYDVHGIAVEVRSAEPRVMEAMDLRLAGFGAAPDGRPPGADAVVLAFLSPEHESNARAAGQSRPVYETPHGTISYEPESDALTGQFGDVRIECEPSRGITRFLAPTFEGRSLYYATHSLASIALMELFERRSLYTLHAGCLGSGDQGVLISGPSGSGKSTLTLALVRAGLSLLSDDIVFLAPGSPVHARGFADAIGLTTYAAERFAELRAHLDVPPADGFPKRLHRIESLFGGSPQRSCVPVAIVFPQVQPGGPCAIERLDGRDALLRLVPDVLLTAAASTQAHLGAIGDLLEQVDCYELTSGADLEQAAGLVLAQLVDRAARSAR